MTEAKPDTEAKHGDPDVAICRCVTCGSTNRVLFLDLAKEPDLAGECCYDLRAILSDDAADALDERTAVRPPMVGEVRAVMRLRAKTAQMAFQWAGVSA